MECLSPKACEITPCVAWPTPSEPANRMHVRDLAMLHFTAALLSNPAHAERVHDHANRMQVVTAAVDAFMEARKC